MDSDSLAAVALWLGVSVVVLILVFKVAWWSHKSRRRDWLVLLTLLAPLPMAVWWLCLPLIRKARSRARCSERSPTHTSSSGLKTESIRRCVLLKPSEETSPLSEMGPIPTTLQDRMDNLGRHFEEAEGPSLHRVLIAIAMHALDNESVIQERSRMSGDDGKVFVMTYECVIMWAILHGLRQVLPPETCKAALNAVQTHFALHADYYQEFVFRRIWERVYICMPELLKGDDDGIINPASILLIAPENAGFPYKHKYLPNMLLSLETNLLLPRIVDAARDAAQSHRVAVQEMADEVASLLKQ